MDRITVATINVANMGEWSNEERIQSFAHSLIEDLQAPMIVAVQELGGLLHEGEIVVRANVADKIIKILSEQFQKDYAYAEIPPLPEASGGAENINIRCGFLYRSDIQLLELSQLGTDVDVFVGVDTGEFVASRLPLLGKFQWNSIEFHVINCHLKSMSIKDQTKQQAKKQRNKQAQFIGNYIQEHQLLDFPLFVMGDMNDTFASKTVQAIASQGLTSAHQALKYQIYSYKYHKKPMLLDYILYNDRVENIESSVVHINTDQNSDRAYSDHDPLMMICRIC